MRITIKDLEAVIARLNRTTGSALEPWTKNRNGKFIANVGNYHLSQAYGGCCIHKIHNEGGGVSTPITAGHVTKRECYDTLHAYLRGMADAAED